jgi:tRNA G18 (ribose-2'-O)-methylase SpoU
MKSKPSLNKRTPIIVVADNIRSVHNVGSLFRTSDAIKASKIYLCGITPHPPRKDIEKTALGATKTVPWTYEASTLKTLLKLKKNGVKICVVERAIGADDYKQADYPFPIALILGNEIDGVSKEALELADMTVSIPMLGKANSLNVSVAYGIVAYEILSRHLK